MPLTHIVLDGDRYTVEEARDFLRERSWDSRWTPELFEAMLAARGPERDYISTTTLTSKCLRQKALEQQFDYEVDLDDLWAAFRGTMFHGQLEQFVAPGSLEEARFFSDRYLDEYGESLSGSPDLVDPYYGVLYDYKFTKAVPTWDRPWKDHVEQCNINRWLVDNCDRMQWRGEVWTPDPTKPRYFVNEAGDQVAVRPRDWQDLVLVYMDDKGIKPLRCYRSEQVPKKHGEGTKPARVADIWTDEQVEELLDERFPEAVKAYKHKRIPLIPEGWEHQSHKLCQFCPVRWDCARLEAEGK